MLGALSKAFALAVPHDDVLAQRDEVAFFQAVRAALPKGGAEGRRAPDEIEHAVRQVVAGAIVTDEVIDVFAAAGLPKPDISILSDEFLAEVRGLPQRTLAVELLRNSSIDLGSSEGEGSGRTLDKHPTIMGGALAGSVAGSGCESVARSVLADQRSSTASAGSDAHASGPEGSDAHGETLDESDAR